MTQQRAAAQEALQRRFGRGDAEIVVEAPGRVNLVGEHTDYNLGLALPFATEQTTAVALRGRSDERIRLYSRELGSARDTRIRSVLQHKGTANGWFAYIAGILSSLASRVRLRRGFDAAIVSSVPLAAGMSSSAALEIGMILALCDYYDVALDDMETVKLCAAAESMSAGTECGLMDPYASLLGERGEALVIDFMRLNHESLDFDAPGVDVLVVESGTTRELSSSGYNQRRSECLAALDVIRRGAPEHCQAKALSSLVRADLDRLIDRNPDLLSRPLRNRALHVISENARVEHAVEAISSNQMGRLGDLIRQSHASLRDLFEVSTPEIDFLVDWGCSHGALGARIMGGGFGGATLHLVPSEAVGDYVPAIQAAYRDRYNLESCVWRTHPGPGARTLHDEATRMR